MPEPEKEKGKVTEWEIDTPQFADFTTDASLSTAGKNASSASLSSGIGEEKKEGDDEKKIGTTKSAKDTKK